MLPTLEYIKQTRRRLGITQRTLADLTGVSTSMINQIECGRCKPSYETARRIFEKFIKPPAVGIAEWNSDTSHNIRQRVVNEGKRLT